MVGALVALRRLKPGQVSQRAPAVVREFVVTALRPVDHLLFRYPSGQPEEKARSKKKTLHHVMWYNSYLVHRRASSRFLSISSVTRASGCAPGERKKRRVDGGEV